MSSAPKEIVGTISSSMINRVLKIPEGNFLVDVLRNPIMRHQKVFIFIDENGNVDAVFEGMKFKSKYIVKSETEGLPPPRFLRTLDEFMRTPLVELERSYEIAKEVLEKTVVFHDKNYYEIVTSWCLWTWIRGLFPKNINLYFLGFPSTGKSQALKFCKHFSRYMTDYDPSSEKSYKWTIAQTLGTLGIDEGEYITKIVSAKLRKYHEAGVVESRMIGLPLVGLTTIDLRVDAPIVLSATHVPSDTAFLQRGFIIRMYKGKPKIKDFDLIYDLEGRKLLFMKSALLNWKKIYDSLEQVYIKLTFKNVDERIKDLALPIATILFTIGKDWEWVIDYARKSFTEANFITPETTAFIECLLNLRERAVQHEGKYIIPLSEVNKLLEEIGEKLGTSSSKLRYLRQYLFSGCEVGLVNGRLCFITDKKTVDTLLQDIEVLKLDVRLLSDPKEDLKEKKKYVPKYLSYIIKGIVDIMSKSREDEIEIKITELKQYFKGSSYYRKSRKELFSRFSKSLRIIPKELKEIGVYDIKLDKENYEIIFKVRKRG